MEESLSLLDQIKDQFLREDDRSNPDLVAEFKGFPLAEIGWDQEEDNGIYAHFGDLSYIKDIPFEDLKIALIEFYHRSTQDKYRGQTLTVTYIMSTSNLNSIEFTIHS